MKSDNAYDLRVEEADKFYSIDHLLVLRGIAAILVFFNHITPNNVDGTIPNFLSINNYNLSWILKPNGSVCIWIFFCLSGYLMGKGFYAERYSCDWTGIKNFYVNRIKRIVPLTYFIILLTIFFSNFNILNSKNFITLLHLLTFTYSFVDNGVASFDVFNNFPLWSLSVEMQFYLLIPILYICINFWLKNSAKKLLLLFILVLLMGLGIKIFLWQTLEAKNLLIIQEEIYTPLYSNLDVFIIGILINPAIKLWRVSFTQFLKIPKIEPLQIPLAWGLIVNLIILSSYHTYQVENYFIQGVKTSMSFVFFPTLTAIITGIFIFINEHKIYFAKRYSSSIFAADKNLARLWEGLGILSFGIYVWHIPVADLVAMNLFTHFSPNLNYWENIGVCLVLTLILSLATYYLVERPFLLTKKYKDLKTSNLNSINDEPKVLSPAQNTEG